MSYKSTFFLIATNFGSVFVCFSFFSFHFFLIIEKYNLIRFVQYLDNISCVFFLLQFKKSIDFFKMRKILTKFTLLNFIKRYAYVNSYWTPPF